MLAANTQNCVWKNDIKCTYFLPDLSSIVLLAGSGEGIGKAWGCDLSYKYVEINAEYTT
jgi:glutamate N-acetyltransferase / amino-acid N-acetyltransferase